MTSTTNGKWVIGALMGAVITLFTVAFGLQVTMVRSQAAQIEALTAAYAAQSERIATVEAKYEEILRRLDAIQRLTERISERTSALEEK